MQFYATEIGIQAPAATGIGNPLIDIVIQAQESDLLELVVDIDIMQLVYEARMIGRPISRRNRKAAGQRKNPRKRSTVRTNPGCYEKACTGKRTHVSQWGQPGLDQMSVDAHDFVGILSVERCATISSTTKPAVVIVTRMMGISFQAFPTYVGNMTAASSPLTSSIGTLDRAR